METLVWPGTLFDDDILWRLIQIPYAPTTDTFTTHSSPFATSLPGGGEYTWTGTFRAPGCSNFMGCLWNSVSGVVGLVSVAWDATAAAAEYLANAAGVLLTDLGITALVDQAVAALKTVASAMEAALQALIAFIEKEIMSLLSTALSPILNGIISYDKVVNQGFGQAQNDTTNGSSIPSSLMETIASALSGTVFEVSLGIAAVIAIALAVATPIDIGPSFLIGTLISILIVVAYQTASTTGLLSSVTNTFGSLSQATIDALQNYIDSNKKQLLTSSTLAGFSSTETSSSTPVWATFSRILLTMVTFSFGFGPTVKPLFSAQKGFGLGFVLAASALALQFTSLAFFVVVLSQSVFTTPDVEILGLFVGIVGIVKMALLLPDSEDDPPLHALQEVVIGLAGLNTLIAFRVDISAAGI
jgi:hypothetical protein